MKDLGKWILLTWVFSIIIAEIIVISSGLYSNRSTSESVIKVFVPVILIGVLAWSKRRDLVLPLWMVGVFLIIWNTITFQGFSPAGAADALNMSSLISNMAMILPYIHLLAGLIVYSINVREIYKNVRSDNSV